MKSSAACTWLAVARGAGCAAAAAGAAPGSGLMSTSRLDDKGRLQGVDLLPAKALPGRWVALQGEIDQVCAAAATQRFVAQVPGAEMVLLPKVGHGYSVERNWGAQFREAFARITGPSRRERTTGDAASKFVDTFAILE